MLESNKSDSNNPVLGSFESSTYFRFPGEKFFQTRLTQNPGQIPARAISWTLEQDIAEPKINLAYQGKEIGSLSAKKFGYQAVQHMVRPIDPMEHIFKPDELKPGEATFQMGVQAFLESLDCVSDFATACWALNLFRSINAYSDTIDQNSSAVLAAFEASTPYFDREVLRFDLFSPRGTGEKIRSELQSLFAAEQIPGQSEIQLLYTKRGGEIHIGDVRNPAPKRTKNNQEDQSAQLLYGGVEFDNFTIELRNLMSSHKNSLDLQIEAQVLEQDGIKKPCLAVSAKHTNYLASLMRDIVDISNIKLQKILSAIIPDNRTAEALNLINSIRKVTEISSLRRESN